MALPDTLPSITYQQVAPPLVPENRLNFALVFGVVDQEDTDGVRLWADADAFRARYGECPASEFAAVHLAADPQRRAFAFCPMPIATPGVMRISSETIPVGDTVTTTVNVGSEPLGYYEPRIECITGGTIGTAGIVLKVSRDGGRTNQTVKLGTANYYEFTGFGMRFDFSAGDMLAGHIIEGWTEAPAWDSTGLDAAAAKIAVWAEKPQIWYFADDLTYTQMQAVRLKLADWNASIDRYWTRAVFNRRLQYHQVSGTGLVINFATATTITRGAGSWLDDGYKPGMHVTIAGATTPGNNGTKIKLSTVTATTLTFSPSPAFTVEAGTIDLVGFEPLTEYQVNLGAEYDKLDRYCVQLSGGHRYSRPDTLDSADRSLGHVFAAMEIRYPAQIQPGVAAQKGDAIGGNFGSLFGSAIVDDDLRRIHLDAANPSLKLLAEAPFGDSGLLFTRSGPTGSISLNWVPNSSADDDSGNPTWVGTRVECFLRALLAQKFAADWMDNIALDDTDPTKFDRDALVSTEAETRGFIATAMAGVLSNADAPSLIALDAGSTPATGLTWNAELVLFYANRKHTIKLKIVTPGKGA